MNTAWRHPEWYAISPGAHDTTTTSAGVLHYDDRTEAVLAVQTTVQWAAREPGFQLDER